MPGQEIIEEKKNEVCRIVVLIPVYNHSNTLRDVVSRTLIYCRDVIVVDDGSTESCLETIAGLDVHVVSHPENRGKGAAIRTGAAHAVSMGFTHMITLDADGQHEPFDIPLFMDYIASHPEDIIIGKRNFNTPNVPFSSVFCRVFFNFWLRVQTGFKSGDVQSGFRAYPLLVFEALTFREKSYSFEVEILVKSMWGGIKLREIDISVVYQKAGERVSHFNLFKDNYYLILLNTRLTLRSFLPWPHRRIKSGARQEKISLLNPLKSLRRIADSGMTPARISISGAVGVFLGALPLIACHTIVILFTAGYFRLSKIMAVVTSQLCAPPFMPALCIEIGYYMRNGRLLTDISLQTLGYEAVDRLYEWFLGALFIGPLAGLCVGFISYGVLSGLKNKKK